jgi:hypothetical protein
VKARATAGPEGEVMLKTLDSPDNVLAVEVVGKLEKEDYETVLLPALRQMIDGPGEIRCVFVFGDDYKGLTLGGTMEDAKLYVGELIHHDLSKWKRCAVVTGHDWLKHSIGMFGWMMPGEVECFALTQVRAAIDWAAE